MHSAAALALARWQFGTTTVFHFFFVPLSIGLAPLVAMLETQHYRTGEVAYRRLAAFFATLFLINFAVGTATGLVQEFQFGMNWSDFSRFVGDVFGVPLALEALVAFFLESTFLGIYIFGRNRLPRWAHLTSAWLLVVGSILSAAMIMAGNSWMQNPVGYTINAHTHTAQLTNLWAVLANPIFVLALPHVLLASFLTGGLFMLGVSAIQLLRGKDVELFRRTMRFAVVWCLITSFLTMVVGDRLGDVVTREQPMKTAAAEALYHTSAPASFSLFAIGTPGGGRLVFNITVPYILSVLATHSAAGEVQGIDNLQRQYEKEFGPGNYVPYVPVTYWGFRIMVGMGGLGFLVALLGLALMPRGRIDRSRLFWWVSILALPVPYIGVTTGWIYTEMGRQPWTVFRLLKTAQAVTPSTGVVSLAISLTGFVLLYTLLGLVQLLLSWRAIQSGPPTEEQLAADHEDGELELTY
ncbi:MAG: cytochrome ubiquinol oxidase subunit I [Candidatus Dormibacteraeota bacterium]|nr:cytochrome ubiquinol oxidase subunit I [Candidatus Dormibacteraeota bacterium]